MWICETESKELEVYVEYSKTDLRISLTVSIKEHSVTLWILDQSFESGKQKN